MKALLTSSGIANASVAGALERLLGKPVEESHALVVPTALLPFPGGPQMAYKAITGTGFSPLTGIGWASLGVLELSALPSIDEMTWHQTVAAADALLVCGGDPVFLAGWLRRSGVAALLPTLPDVVYVGVSAGSIAAATTFAETYLDPPRDADAGLTSEKITFSTPEGDVDRYLVTSPGAGLVDVAVIPHLDNSRHPDASLPNAELWAARIPLPTYAIDDQSAVVVVDGVAEVVSEGRWRRFEPR